MTNPFWKSTKFAYTVLATGAFLTMSLTGTVSFTEGQVLTFVLAVLGGNLVTHTATDIAAITAAKDKNDN